MADNKRKDSDLTTSLTSKQAQAESSLPGQYQGKEFKLSDNVLNAIKQQGQLQKPGAYNATWQQSMNDTLNKYLNRDPFSYDVTGDALYQQYKDQYVTQGQMAMMDTMGQAAAMTGGYGNSYAQGVGQQAYQGYLQQLNDKVPELYQLALNKYNQEGEALLNQYGLLADADNREYSRNEDAINHYYNERDYLNNYINQERNWEYGLYSDDWNRGYQLNQDAYNRAFDKLTRYDNLLANSQSMDEERYQFDTTQGYNENQAVKNEAYSLLQSGVMPSADMLAKAGIDSATAKALQKAATTAASSKGSGSSDSTVKNLNWKELDELDTHIKDIIDESGRSKAADYIVGLWESGRISKDDFEDLLRDNDFQITSTGNIVDTNVAKTAQSNTLGARAEKLLYMKN